MSTFWLILGNAFGLWTLLSIIYTNWTWKVTKQYFKNHPHPFGLTGKVLWVASFISFFTHLPIHVAITFGYRPKKLKVKREDVEKAVREVEKEKQKK